MYRRAWVRRWLAVTLGAGLVLAMSRSASALMVSSLYKMASINGDAYADVVVGVPYEDVDQVVDAGAVTAFYGGPSGLSAAGAQVWSQGSAFDQVEETSSGGDLFGTSLALGDFNGDGRLDLAVGIPMEDLESPVVLSDAGAVHLLYGTLDGLSADGDVFFSQNNGDVDGDAQSGDAFGFALAACDFDGDGYGDLAVGIPGEKVGTESVKEGGAVQVFRGTTYGLVPADDRLWHQDVVGIADAAEEGDLFGAALASGDFDGNGLCDLAIGVPGENGGAGAIHVLLGTTGGLSAAGALYWSQGTLEMEDAAEAGDGFGRALAVGDFDGDGYDDLAVGVPDEDVGTLANAGAVHLLYGELAGVTADRDRWLSQDSLDTAQAAAQERFGASIVSGDFDGNGFDDLAVGAPGDSASVSGAGAVSVLYGSGSGLTVIGTDAWKQGADGILEVSEEADGFGAAVAAGDVNADAHSDLIVGVPAEDYGGAADVGVLHVIYGSDSGLGAGGNQLWVQGAQGVPGSAEAGDKYGYAIVAAPRRSNAVLLPLLVRLRR